MKTQSGASGRAPGLQRVLVVSYLILALAATGRSAYQIVRKFDEAPLAYSLSLLAAVVYVVATVALLKGWHRIAWAALIFELCGVLMVGTLSIVAPQLFAHPAVWSYYGAGYLLIPLVLPVLGMLWLRSVSTPQQTAVKARPANSQERSISA